MDPQQARLLRQIDPQVLGSRMREARVAAGLTQGQLAAGDVTVGYISRIEAGQRRPDAKVLELLATRLRTPVGHLLLGVSSREYDELRLALDYAELCLETGEAADAERRTLEVLQRRATESLVDLRDRACFLHARAVEAQGRLEEAINDLERLVEEGDRSAHWVAASVALSRCCRDSGDLGRAVEVGERVLAQLDAVGAEAPDEAVQLAVTVAAAHFELGDAAHAVALCEKALRRSDGSEPAAARAAAYWNASLAEAQRGAVAAAIPMAEKALSVLAEGRDARNLARLRLQLGIMQLQSDPPFLQDARDSLTRAREELRASGAGAVDLARCDVALARARFVAGDVAGARQGAVAAFGATDGAPMLAADARALEGQAAARLGDWDAAKAAFRDAVRILTEVGADRSAGQLWFELGGLLDEAGEAEAARDAYRSAAAAAGMRSRSSISARL
jgi:tetratricopeptide (TPR) repeat protein